MQIKLLILLGVILLTGCYTLPKCCESRLQIQVQPRLSFAPVADKQRTVFIAMQQPEPLPIHEYLSKFMRQKGYKVVANPQKAHFLLQGRVLKLKKIQGKSCTRYQITTKLQVIEHKIRFIKEHLPAAPFNPYLVYGRFTREFLSQVQGYNDYHLRIIATADGMHLSFPEASCALSKETARAIANVLQ